MSKVGVIGAGSWGTALAITLAQKGHQVYLWGRHPEEMKKMEEDRCNKKYLPNITLPEGLFCTSHIEQAFNDADYIVYSVPAQSFRSVFNDTKKMIKKDAIVVNVAKGIEQGTLLRMSEIAREVAPKIKYVTLSGPSHAEEVGKGLPTVIVVASEDEDGAKKVQDLFMTERFRVYTGHDIIGVELGGALKNIIALGAGISDGIGFGDNAKAAIMTRGLTEMIRLGVAMGAKADTFAGLTGMGDLIVTCTSMHSRNRRCGIMIGEGMDPQKAVEKVGMVVEGVATVEAAYGLANKLNVEMPITTQIYKVIHTETTPEVAVATLMGRDKKPE